MYMFICIVDFDTKIPDIAIHRLILRAGLNDEILPHRLL